MWCVDDGIHQPGELCVIGNLSLDSLEGDCADVIILAQCSAICSRPSMLLELSSFPMTSPWVQYSLASLMWAVVHALLAVPGHVVRAAVQPAVHVYHLKPEPECLLLQGQDPRIGNVSKEF